MEFHAPDHPVMTWRQFFIHIGIVTVGILIALSLESLVEWRHHRALVNEARENIRREIDENRTQLKQNDVDVQADMTRMAANLQLLATLRTTGHTPEGSGLQYRLAWSGLSDTAWTTARDTGALGFMKYSEVQCYAGIYTQQQIINTQAMALFQAQVRAVSPVLIGGKPDALTPEERERVLARSADLLADLKVVGQLMSQWDTRCAN